MNCAQFQKVVLSPQVKIQVSSTAKFEIYNPSGPPDYWTYDVTLTGNETKEVEGDLWNDWNKGELLCNPLFQLRVIEHTNYFTNWYLRGNLPGTQGDCAGRAGLKGYLQQSVQANAFTASYQATNGGPDFNPSTHDCLLEWLDFQTSDGYMAGVTRIPLNPMEPDYPGHTYCPPGLLPIGGFYRIPVYNPEEPWQPPVFANRWSIAPSALFGYKVARGDTGQKNVYERAHTQSGIGYYGRLLIHPSFDMDFSASLYDGETITAEWGSVQFLGLKPQ